MRVLLGPIVLSLALLLPACGGSFTPTGGDGGGGDAAGSDGSTSDSGASDGGLDDAPPECRTAMCGQPCATPGLSCPIQPPFCLICRAVTDAMPATWLCCGG